MTRRYFDLEAAGISRLAQRGGRLKVSGQVEFFTRSRLPASPKFVATRTIPFGQPPRMESMSGYALPHGLAGEEQRLALMSTLLDPFEFACIEHFGVGQGCRCLEFGCGNRSISLLKEFETCYQGSALLGQSHHV